MHPLSTALFVLGYALALPVIARLGRVRASGNRFAIIGHQVGMIVALLGWALRGSVALTLFHVVWIVGIRIWFGNDRPGTDHRSTDRARA